MFPMYKNNPESCAKQETTTTPPSRHEPYHHNHNHNPTATIPPPPPSSMFSPAPIMLAVTSWLRTRRIRYVFLLLCSPLLLPFLCATFPILCAAEICIRICRRITRPKAAAAEAEAEAQHESREDERLRRCEEGDRIEERQVGLLQRYLEDQLLLVGSVYECGDDDEFDVDRKIPLLS